MGCVGCEVWGRNTLLLPVSSCSCLAEQQQVSVWVSMVCCFLPQPPRTLLLCHTLTIIKRNSSSSSSFPLSMQVLSTPSSTKNALPPPSPLKYGSLNTPQRSFSLLPLPSRSSFLIDTHGNLLPPPPSYLHVPSPSTYLPPSLPLSLPMTVWHLLVEWPSLGTCERGTFPYVEKTQHSISP